jgi:hypothetical protein
LFIAALVACLASEECSFSTGVAFDLSGARAVYPAPAFVGAGEPTVDFAVHFLSRRAPGAHVVRDRGGTRSPDRGTIDAAAFHR